MFDVRIPIKSKKITLNDVVDVMLDGLNKVNNRLDVIETDINDLKVRMTNVENRLDNFENVIKLNNLRTE